MKKRRDYIEGTISINRQGVGFLKPDNEKREIRMEKGNLGRALNGDTVAVVFTNRGVPRVERVIKRNKEKFIGIVEKRGRSVFVISNEKRKVIASVPKKSSAKLSNGDKVYFRLIDKEREFGAEIIKNLGESGSHETEISAIIYNSGFVYDFGSQAINEAKKAERDFKKTVESELKKRRDFREITTFTIDPETAKDFDDALSLRKISDKKYEVGIHIADVSFFVTPDSSLDKEAVEKTTSLYLVDRTVPMLPEELSANICSLRPNEERLAYSAVFEMNDQAEVTDRWFGRTVIKSDHRFTYKEAQGIIDNGEGKFNAELKILNNLAKKLRKKRIEKGAIIFDSDEVDIRIDKNGKPISIEVKERVATMKLVEELMLLANREVATYATKTGKGPDRPFIYRVHENPDPAKIVELSVFLHGLGYELDVKNGKVSAKDLEKVFEASSKTDEAGLIETAALRSMAKAKYTTKNRGHFGLGFKYYTHFTSPIRRYPDILAHRLLDLYLNGGRPNSQTIRKYEELAKRSTEKEIEADKAERDSIKYKQAEYMAERIGLEVEGVITGIVDWGFYVQDEKTLTEGLVHISSISEDYYEVNSKEYVITGKRTGKRFRLGDRVKVRVAKADPDERTIDFELV